MQYVDLVRIYIQINPMIKKNTIRDVQTQSAYLMTLEILLSLGRGARIMTF